MRTSVFSWVLYCQPRVPNSKYLIVLKMSIIIVSTASGPNHLTGNRLVTINYTGRYLCSCVFSLHWRHNDNDGVSNHQPHGCLLIRLSRRRSRKTSTLRVTGLCAGISPGPVNSPHKGPVTRKMFPFDDVIMLFVNSYWPTSITVSTIYTDRANHAINSCLPHPRSVLFSNNTLSPISPAPSNSPTINICPFIASYRNIIIRCWRDFIGKNGDMSKSKLLTLIPYRDVTSWSSSSSANLPFVQPIVYVNNKQHRLFVRGKVQCSIHLTKG